MRFKEFLMLEDAPLGMGGPPMGAAPAGGMGSPPPPMGGPPGSPPPMGGGGMGGPPPMGGPPGMGGAPGGIDPSQDMKQVPVDVKMVDVWDIFKHLLGKQEHQTQQPKGVSNPKAKSFLMK